MLLLLLLLQLTYNTTILCGKNVQGELSLGGKGRELESSRPHRLTSIIVWWDRTHFLCIKHYFSFLPPPPFFLLFPPCTYYSQSVSQSTPQPLLACCCRSDESNSMICMQRVSQFFPLACLLEPLIYCFFTSARFSM